MTPPSDTSNSKAKTPTQALFKESRSQFHCPSCGAVLPRLFKQAKIAACEYCHSVLYLKGAEAQILATQAELADYPALFELHHRYVYDDLMFEPVGMLRFSYGRGFWDEWWCLTDSESGRWISVDEGDFVLEAAIHRAQKTPQLNELQPNSPVELLETTWTVTEIGQAEYVGMRGELPEMVDPKRKFDYVHLSRPGSKLITLEYDSPDDTPSVFSGQWMDAFKIKAL